MAFRGPHPDGLVVTIRPAAGPTYDITAGVTGIAVRRGRTDPIDRYRTGTVAVGLRNEDGAFSPWNRNGRFGRIDPNWLVTVKLGNGRSIFVGYLDGIDEGHDGGGAKIATLFASDGFKLLARANGRAVASVGSGETSGVRVARILDKAGWSASLRAIDTSAVTLHPTTHADFALDELFGVADSDPGWVLIDKSGKFTFWKNAHSETNWTNSRWTFSDNPGTGELPYDRIETAADDTQLINVASVQHKLQTSPTVVTDSTSITAHGERVWSRTGLWHNTDAQSTTIGNAVLDRCKNTLVRVDAVEFDCDELTSASTLWTVADSVELHDKVTVEHSAGSARQSTVAYVESIEHHILPHSWKVRLGLGPVVSQSNTLDAPANLTIVNNACFTATATWTVAQGGHSYIEVRLDIVGGADGIWTRIPASARQYTWNALSPGVQYEVNVQLVFASGKSTATTATFTSPASCINITVGGDGTINSDPRTDITCATGYTRYREWQLYQTTVDQEGFWIETQIDSGIQADDGTNLTGVDYPAGQLFKVCIRIVCRQDAYPNALVPQTDWNCRAFVRTAAGDCTRPDGDAFESIWDDYATTGTWVDWCPGLPVNSPVQRETGSNRAMQARDGLIAIVDGPTSAVRSLAGLAGPGDPAAVVLAVGDLGNLSVGTTDTLAVTFWAYMPPLWTSIESYVPLITLGNGVEIFAWFTGYDMDVFSGGLGPNIRIGLQYLFRRNDGTGDVDTWVQLGWTSSSVAKGAWFRIDLVYDKASNLTIAIDGENKCTVAASDSLRFVDDTIQLMTVPSGRIGQVMVWGATSISDMDAFTTEATLTSTDTRAITWVPYGAASFHANGGLAGAASAPKAFGGYGDACFANEGLSNGTMEVDVVLGSLGSQVGAGLCFRVGASGVNGYLTFIYQTLGGSRLLYVEKYVSGTLTTVYAGTTNVGGPALIHLVVSMSGTSVTVQAKNGATVVDSTTFTDSAHTTNTRHGLCAYNGATGYALSQPWTFVG